MMLHGHQYCLNLHQGKQLAGTSIVLHLLLLLLLHMPPVQHLACTFPQAHTAHC
jgi:hypothetical protein